MKITVGVKHEARGMVVCIQRTARRQAVRMRAGLVWLKKGGWGSLLRS